MHTWTGAETEHKGIGQCIKHGGNTTNAKKHAAKVQVEQRMTQAVAVVEAQAFGIGRPREAVDPFEEIAVSLWRRQDRVPPAREVAVWRMARDAGLAWTPPGAEGLTLETRQAA